ncbi:TPA: HNH endonuclease [Escherichia coli]|uniref:HNH endonuclease signature motif containing protein n=1 Tax=Escherichia coli TaxID=562 RepID=UPI000D17709E|nr:HNH endonuclease signature motif containing protein [Escherichia coli]EFH1556594.1 HNH endonuclease [Escherichia coli]EFJ1932420.1 HNH endonuclease [Escherichia coli]EFM0603703.1 HNH endonuclease [Escherichia coli]PSZ05540.1 hypothetical protein C7B13_05945 [Escherichia coli]HAV8496067.1 HNH endonuclease [Escherichia coli]
MSKKIKKNIKITNGYSGIRKMEYGVQIFRRMQSLKSEGKSYEEATRIAKNKICGTIENRVEAANLRRWYNLNVDQVALKVYQKDNSQPVAAPTKPPPKTKIRSFLITPDESEQEKYDSWYAAKLKQDAENKNHEEQKRIEAALIRHPIGCIECKIDFKSFGRFVDHARDIHRVSVSKPKLVVVDEIPIDDSTYAPEKPRLPPTEEVISIPTAKRPESFNDKWIRLFTENGYTVAMVEAFKREATKQGMDVKQAHKFLSVCKPSKHIIKAPVSPIEAIANIGQSTNENTVETLTEAIVAAIAITADNSSYTPIISDTIERALFADRIVRTRTNQNDFKERVAANFGYRCAITDSGEALEAAHIEPVGTGNNSTSNGILMLACLHRLFDTGLMAINPEALTVHFKADCTYFAKSMLEGKKLCDHMVLLNKLGLVQRWLNFTQ